MRRSLSVTCLHVLFFLCLGVYGCATGPRITTLTGVKSFEKYSGGYLDKVMVVGKGRSDANRMNYENYIARALEKRKVEAITSYTLIPKMFDLNIENMSKAARSAGVKAVLVSKLVGIDEKDAIFEQSTDYIYHTTSKGIYMNVYTFGPQAEKLVKVRLETGLFEVESEKLLWGATSDIMNPESADEAIEDFSKAIIQQLEKDGYIR